MVTAPASHLHQVGKPLSGVMGCRVLSLSNLDALTEKYNRHVLKVGVTDTRYVSLKHCRPWVIHAYRNIKGRGLHKEEEGETGKLLDEGSRPRKRRRRGELGDVLAPVEEDQRSKDRPLSDPTDERESKSEEDAENTSADHDTVREAQETHGENTHTEKSGAKSFAESETNLKNVIEMNSEEYQKLQGSDDVAIRRDVETELQPDLGHSVKTATSQIDRSQPKRTQSGVNLSVAREITKGVEIETQSGQSKQESGGADQSLTEQSKPSATWSYASEMTKPSAGEVFSRIALNKKDKKTKAEAKQKTLSEEAKLKPSLEEAKPTESLEEASTKTREEASIRIREDTSTKTVEEESTRAREEAPTTVREGALTRTRGDKKRKAPDDETGLAKSEPEVKSTYDKVRLICQPWRKPEGGVNKPVLKMMIESVMLFLTFNPGSSLKALYHRYTPYLQPMVLRNIVEILEDIGCITRQYMKPAKVSLFSKPFQTQEVGEDRGDCQVILLPTPESLYRLGQFGLELYPGVEWPKSEEFSL